MSVIPEYLEGWIESVVAAAPAHVRLIYLEWNNAYRGAQKLISFHAFGYSLSNFDPEDPASLSALREWVWEAADSCETEPEVAEDDQALSHSLLKRFSANSSLGGPIHETGRTNRLRQA